MKLMGCQFILCLFSKISLHTESIYQLFNRVNLTNFEVQKNNRLIEQDRLKPVIKQAADRY